MESQTNEKKKKKDKLMTETIEKLESDVLKTGSIDIHEFMKVLYINFFSSDSEQNLFTMYKKLVNLESTLEKQESEVKRLTTENINLQKNVRELEKKVTELEVDDHKNKIVLRGVKTTNKGQNDIKEKPLETKKHIENILSITGQTLDVIDDCYRLYPKKPPKMTLRKSDKQDNDNIPNIFLKFTTQLEMKRFLYNLKNIKKNQNYEGLRVEHMCPPSMKNDYNSAQKEAARLRLKNFLTHVKIKKEGVKLEIKNKKDPTDKEFIEVDYPKESRQ